MGLIGPNGSGKTTLLNVISGLVTPREGSIRLDGEPSTATCPRSGPALGVVRSFQDCRLFPDLQVEDVLLVALDARRPVGVASSTLQLPWARHSERDKRAEVDRVIGSFGIGPFRHHRIAQLSTGTRRVVDLASIVLARPRLLLLDEPTAGIAQREAEAFVPLLSPAARGGGHHHRARRARRPAGLRAVHEGGDDGVRVGGVLGDPRRGGARSPCGGRLPRRQRRCVVGVRGGARPVRRTRESDGPTPADGS